jgi:hypothetical protein
MTGDKTVYVIFNEAPSYPKHPAYEGTDLTLAAQTVLKASDAGKNTAIRVRWRGKLTFGLGAEINLLTEEIKRQRKAKVIRT